ncbi:DEAD/DEAH box helicase family protein [Mycolicibacterium flavescens]|uniref:Helicase n=1 Tax=Mycolicibacterium flavescens TaxID=1776 RepID=A0A1E3RM16_MYCFV|nr:SNF2-related protein [Mycolicibacterium flavescens]MCV7281671.1 DEAD/DEAH box helicase family protein [Mycolicibacterium flavescens]ODQ90923.1 helicase [Mycolicibacterium flavescens]
MIEKRLTEQLLENGELALTERESAALALPEHSSAVELELDGEAFTAQWNGRGRQLSGEFLTERLQDYGQVGGLLRLRLVEQVYRVQLLPPGTPSKITIAKPPPPVDRTKGAKAKRRRSTVDRQFHADSEYDWGKRSSQTIGFLSQARELLAEQLKAAGFDARELVELRLQGEELATLDDFEELLAVDVSNVDKMPHQEAVARHALSRLRGRAVLADEVGLGKTIEAGLAVKELTLRGLAKRVLILCPAPLREQWREEMRHKFDLNFEVATRGPEVQKQDKLILSLHLARSNADKLTEKPWDIVILDEAHRAAGYKSHKTRDLITSLTTACRYAFFLTATPVQNDLLELYRLVELLRPGTFTSVTDFRRQFMSGYDPRTPNDPAALRRLISSVMVRTTRAQAGVDRVVRRAVDVPITLGNREHELYALATELLRNVMRDPGDAMRRRSLALRLTASPFSMGTTALRMADRHPDPRVREVLHEVGHLAMDITASAREDRALQITQGWLREHGRVLIFTQHTDTVTGLLRRMELEGLTARSFHGSMSPTERAKTIAAFRSGEAPIMISTDAGAEGQNLQFCNCVLNYDLPWNPMRIEQRIGRVDRLTQPKDEVFVANLYAQNTIDEKVFWLLAEKLRMFELLFGQVTTILGELDESKAASFETRVMEALFAESDTKMNRLLNQLGTELVHAREKASELIAADSNMSSWMAAAFDHRKGLTKAGSSDLAPAASRRARMRQRRVQTWVRKVLKALDADIIHDTGNGDGAFITAVFNEEFEQELGGRTTMHLAFDRFGLEHHPEAELCAVGSPVFDELLGLLRVRGDMHATIPVIPDDIGPTPYRHAESIRLVRRRLVPSGSWSGQATFRATVGEAETAEHLITAEIDGHREQRLPRRPLDDGESLPPAFGTPPQVIAQFERAAIPQLESLRRQRLESVERQQALELERVTSGYRAQIAEATGEDRARLDRALRTEERRLTRRPDVRARAKVLAVTLDEDDWLIEETWAGPSGDEITLTYEWGVEPPVVDSAVSGRAIGVLALCSDMHWIDESEVTHCGSCDRSLCEACGDDAVFSACAVCGQWSCGRCRRETGGLCRTCASPQRAPQLDDEFFIAWTLGGGNVIRVGERVAELIRPDGSPPAFLVSTEDYNDSRRARLRAYARENNLPLDCGLTLRDLTARQEQNDNARVRLTSDETVLVRLSVEPAAGAAIVADAISDVPQHPDVDVSREDQFGLDLTLQKLRSEVPPPPRPAVLVTHRSEFVDFLLEAERLVREENLVQDDGSLLTHDSQTVDLCWRRPSLEDETIAEAGISDLRVTLLRRNEAVLIDAYRADKPVGQWIACPDGMSAAEQVGCYEHLRSLGAPGGRLGQQVHSIEGMVGSFPSPSECSATERDFRSVVGLVETISDTEVVPATSESLAAIEIPENREAASIPLAPPGLTRSVLARATRPFTAALRNGLEVREVWHGYGTATHIYRTFDGQPMSPLLDDTGTRSSDFGVCRDGHFYTAGTAAFCPACDSWACPSCDDVEHRASVDCPGCAHAVCRRCVSATHSVPDTSCRLCGDHACVDCGRDPDVAGCAMCERTMCGSCRVEDLCPACNQYSPATDDQTRALPRDLATDGASVLIASDKDATVALINRGNAYEQAIVRGGSVVRWRAFDRTPIDSRYRLRLAASRALKAQVVPMPEALEAEAPRTAPRVTLRSDRRFHPAWTAPALNAAARSVDGQPTPDEDLPTLLAREFPVPSRYPEGTLKAPARLRPLLVSLDQPSTTPILMRWERVGSDVAIVPAGISVVTIDGASEQETITEWRNGDHSLDWVSQCWNPVPAVRMTTDGGGVEAALVSMAGLVALGVHTSDDTAWYVIAASEHAPAATLLARSMGLGDADEVGTFTDPGEIRLSAVANATNAPHTVTPRGELKPAASGRADHSTEAAFKAWSSDATVTVPPLRVLPDAMRIALQKLVAPAQRQVLEIGASVVQNVTVHNGHEWRYEVALAPGDTDARRIDHVTRQLADWGGIDREGHFGTTHAVCGYCNETSCSACNDGMVVCDCCAAPICRRCVREPSSGTYLCHACTSMRPPTRQEAREHGRLLFTRGMLIGIDPLHTVVVEREKSRWELHVGEDGRHAIANPSVVQYLNDCLARSD